MDNKFNERVFREHLIEITRAGREIQALLPIVERAESSSLVLVMLVKKIRLYLTNDSCSLILEGQPLKAIPGENECVGYAERFKKEEQRKRVIDAIHRIFTLLASQALFIARAKKLLNDNPKFQADIWDILDEEYHQFFHPPGLKNEETSCV